MLTASDRLRPRRPTLIVTSPLTRALQSAHILAQQLDLPLAVEPGLREWMPGDGPGHVDHAEFQQALAEMLDAGGEWPEGQRRCWEPLSAVRLRVIEALSSYESEEMVVVTHGVVIYALTGEDAPPGGVVEISADAINIDRTPVAPVVAEGPATAIQTLRLRHPTAAPGPLWDQVALVWELDHRADAPALDRAVLRLVERHPLLRSSFAMDEAGRSYRWSVLRRGEAACRVVDGKGATGPDAWIRQDVHDRMPGLEWPLFRVTVVRGDRDIVGLVAHGLIGRTADARQLGTELLGLYDQERRGAAEGPRQAPRPETHTSQGPPLPARDPVFRQVALLDSEASAALIRRFEADDVGLLDILLAAVSHALPHDDPDGSMRLLVTSRCAGLRQSPRVPDESVSGPELLELPPCTDPSTVARLRTAGVPSAVVTVPPWRCVVDFDMRTAGCEPATCGPDPYYAAWRSAVPVLTFEERDGNLATWLPVGEERGAHSLHEEVARLLRRWATS